jgi:hypothetical protein
VSSLGVVVSGGVDALLCLSYPTASGLADPKKILPYSNITTMASLAGPARLVLHQNPQSLEVFRLSDGTLCVCLCRCSIAGACVNGACAMVSGYDADRLASATRSEYVGKSLHSKSPAAVGLAADPGIAFTHVAKIAVKGGESDVSCSQLSPDGKWLAYATVSKFRVFQVITDDCGDIKVWCQVLRTKARCYTHPRV